MSDQPLLVIKTDHNGLAMFACPECSFKRRFDPRKCRDKNSQARIICTCGKHFNVRFQFHEASGETPADKPVLASGLLSPDDPHGLPVFTPDAANQINILCPSCNRGNRVAIDNFKHASGVFGFNCKCGRNLRGRIEMPPDSVNPGIGEQTAVSPDLPYALMDKPVLREPDFINGKNSHTVHLSSEGKVTFICPKCGWHRTLTESERAKYPVSFGLDCRCGMKYECRVDFRKYYRKRVNLPGTFFQTDSWTAGDICVHDISLRGVGFCTVASHQLKLGDIIQVQFRLDDKKRTEIKRQLVVRFIEKNRIGAQFMTQNTYDKDLGFYLLK